MVSQRGAHAPHDESSSSQTVMLTIRSGYSQSGPLFRSKTGAMSKMMAKALPDFGAERFYPTGPHRLRPADIPGFQPREGADGEAGAAQDEVVPDSHGWFFHDEEAGPLRGLEEGMRCIADAIEEAGGVDGVLGFSQGGAVGALVAAALEPGRTLPQGEEEGAEHAGWARRLREANGGRSLRFCVVYSGFVARPGARLGWLYEGGVKTSSCHFFGSLDTVVDETMSQALADKFVGADVVVHPGGHHVPVRKEWVAPLLGYLRKVLDKPEEEAQDTSPTES